MLARTGDFDLVLLDIGLPGMDGFTVLKNLRGEGVRTPVIILTARDSVRDTVIGLESGANDYVSKPFQFAELLARVRLRLREEPSGGEPAILRSGDIVLDLRTRRAEVEGRTYDLTSREFALLEVLLRDPSQVLSREQILGHVWGYDFDPGSNFVDVYVRSLRNKIGPNRIATSAASGTDSCEVDQGSDAQLVLARPPTFGGVDRHKVRSWETRLVAYRNRSEVGTASAIPSMIAHLCQVTSVGEGRSASEPRGEETSAP